MISFFRRALSSWLVLGLLGLILVAFIVTGVGSPGGLGAMGGGAQGATLATVGREPIGVIDVNQRLRRQLQMVQQQNPNVDMAAFLAAGGMEQTLDQTIASRALEVFAQRQGMVASRRLVDGEIASIGAFRGPSGKFDPAAFAAALQQQHLSEAQLRSEIAGDAIRRQMLVPIASNARIPAGLVAPYASLLLESRAGQIGLVPAAAMGGGTPPTDAEIGAFYQRNIAAYTLAERRVLRYAAFGLDSVAAKAKPSEAEIAAFYKANAATYAASEKRDLSQVVLDSEAKARAFAAKVAGGMPFAKAASDAGFQPADTKVGLKTRAELAALASPAVAAAAFAAAQGAVSAPAKSDFGWHVVRVDAVQGIAARPLAVVHDEISGQLARQKADEALSDMVAAIEDAISGGSSFDEVVKAQGLSVVTTPPLLASGQAPGAPDWQVPPEVAALVKPAFETGPDEDPTVETVVAGQRLALLGVARVVPAAPMPLAQVRARVLADLAAERAQRRAEAVATAIVAKANAGVAVATAFAEAGMKLPPVQKAGGRRIDLAQSGKRVPPPLAMMFAMKAGTAKLLEAPGKQGWFVVRLDSIVPGNAALAPGLIEATRGQLGRVAGEEYLEQFANAAQGEIGVKRDDKAIARMRAQLRGGGDAQ